MAHRPGSPEPREYNPYFEGYISRAREISDPVARLAEQLEEVLSLLNTLEPATRLHSYAPDKWSIQELLGHITDTERIFAYRLLRVARGDETPLPGFDENPYVVSAEAEKCEWGSLVEEFACVRRSSLFLLANLPEAAWTRVGTTSNHPTSVRALAYIMIGHVEHHLAILRARYLGRAGN